MKKLRDQLPVSVPQDPLFLEVPVVSQADVLPPRHEG